MERHGGDILKFAGDAIIVCWSPTRELGVEVVVPVGRGGVAKPKGSLCTTQYTIPWARYPKS